MAEYGERQAQFADQMSDVEALMWNVEKDPWLSSTMATVVITDQPVDPVRLHRRLASGAASIARLRARVEPGLGRLTAPRWQPDPEFDLGYHVRRIALPAPGDQATLYEVACRIIEDPFDRTRPLWQFVVVDGLADGRGALIVKLHHSVTDGLGALRLAEQYMDKDRQATGRVDADVNLDAVIAADLAQLRRGPDQAPSPDRPAGGAGHIAGGAAHMAGGAAQAARRWAGDAMVAMADPTRLTQLGESLVTSLRQGAHQADTAEAPSASPLWARRSRRRVLRTLELDLATVKAAAKASGGSVNDFFLAGTALAAGRYHQRSGLTLEQVTASFVVSTRGKNEVAGNAFRPVKATIPTGITASADGAGGAGAARASLVAEVHTVLANRRAEVGPGAGLLASLAGAVNLMPTSVVTRLARAQAAGIDFATSNVRAAPFPVYIAGAKVVATYPVGPVAGTAFNLTMMSYCDGLFLALHADPVAVQRPDELLACLSEAFNELLAAVAPRPKRSAASRPRRTPSPSSARRSGTPP